MRFSGALEMEYSNMNTFITADSDNGEKHAWMSENSQNLYEECHDCHFVFLHFNKNAEFIITNTDPAL